MSENAAVLVQKLNEAGEWPVPVLLEEILARGQEAVEPLLEILRRQPHGWPEEAPLLSAIMLLGMLRPPEALAPLIDLLRHYDNEALEEFPEALAGYGPEVVEPALAIVRDASLPSYPRSVAASVAIYAAREHPDLRATIAATLRELLAEHLARAPEPVEDAEDEDEDNGGEDEDEDNGDEDEDEEEPGLNEADGPRLDSDYFAMATSLVEHLAELGDPQARDLIKDAFDAGIVDEGWIEQPTIEEIYREADEPPKKISPHSPLERYRARYRENQEREHRQTREARRAIEPPPPPLPLFSDDSAPQPFRHERKQVGRNDPCWCGSGKKYKKCHLRQDQQ